MRKARFTALLHQVNVDTLRLVFYALKRKAAPGVDGVTWQDYEAELEPRLEDLHRRVPDRKGEHPNLSRDRWFADSLLEGNGFEPLVPNGRSEMQWIGPGRVSPALTRLI